MVSKRQILAKRRFKEEHPELFPKADPTPPSDPTKKKKKKQPKKSTFKPKSNDDNNPKKKSFSKHPLRVAGMKPGESCYICKQGDHIAKNCPEKSLWEKNKVNEGDDDLLKSNVGKENRANALKCRLYNIQFDRLNSVLRVNDFKLNEKCLLCRRRGHSLQNCPNKTDSSSEKKFCYNCGDITHTLANCPNPLQDGGTKFAVCFICKGRGHLSKNCPENTHGIYPEGGCCEICQEKTHLMRDCPQKASSGRNASNSNNPGFDGRPTGRVTKFASGDDLEDDFMVEKDDVKDDSLKKKQGPKVINFAG